jgi:hypothetical protein
VKSILEYLDEDKDGFLNLKEFLGAFEFLNIK